MNDNTNRCVSEQDQAFYFTIPRTFDPLEFLPQRLVMHADYAKYFASLLMRKLASGKVDDKGFVALNTKILHAVIPRDQCKPIIESLLEGGAVRRTNYVVGTKSFSYALADRYMNDRHIKVPVMNRRLIERLRIAAAAAEEKRRSRMKPIHHRLEALQRRLWIDQELAREIIDGLPPESNPYDVQGMLVSNIASRDFRFSVGRYGRVSNWITNLKREIRQALRADDQHLVGVDISCCQPALLALMIRESRRFGAKGPDSYNAYPVGCPLAVVRSVGPDVAPFERLALSGCLYDRLLARVNDNRKSESRPLVSRSALKHDFLRDVLAKKRRGNIDYSSEVEAVFKEQFPSVWKYIRRVNKGGWKHENLIRELQRWESWLVIETVCERLREKNPGQFMITIHDAIYTKPELVETVTATFGEVFDGLEFPMTVKTE